MSRGSKRTVGKKKETAGSIIKTIKLIPDGIG